MPRAGSLALAPCVQPERATRGCQSGKDLGFKSGRHYCAGPSGPNPCVGEGLTRRLAAVGRAAHTPIESGGRTMYRLLAASLVVALTTMSSAAAQGDLKQPIGRCATQDGDLKRLACYDSIAKSLGYSRTPTAANVPGSGGWQVSTQKNPLDDTRTGVLSLSATSGQARSAAPACLAIRCRRGRSHARS